MKTFKYSGFDAILVIIAVIQFCATIHWICNLETWGIVINSLWVISLSMLMCTNYQCIAHNFIHNPFFESKLVNLVFSAFNSVNLGVPQKLYYAHHMNHHQYNNDHKGAGDSSTKDSSSIYRHGKRGRAENLIKYSVLTFFRLDFIQLFKTEQISFWSPSLH